MHRDNEFLNHMIFEERDPNYDPDREGVSPVMTPVEISEALTDDQLRDASRSFVEDILLLDPAILRSLVFRGISVEALVVGWINQFMLTDDMYMNDSSYIKVLRFMESSCKALIKDEGDTACKAYELLRDSIKNAESRCSAPTT